MEIKLYNLKTKQFLQSIKNEEMREIEIGRGELTATVLCKNESERNTRYIQFAELIKDDIACSCVLRDSSSFKIRINTDKIYIKIED